MYNRNLIIAIILISSPILFALVVYPDTFSLSWNQGRGGFLFALAFIVAELLGLKLEIPKKRIIAVIPLAVLTIIYLVALENGLREFIEESGEASGSARICTNPPSTRIATRWNAGTSSHSYRLPISIKWKNSFVSRS